VFLASVPTVARSGTSYGPTPIRWSARLSTPPGWFRAALCIHSKEGAWNSNTGNGYFGGLQFMLGTWRSVGGPSWPHLVSPREQLYRAYLVWKRDGGSWREWGTARLCGLI